MAEGDVLKDLCIGSWPCQGKEWAKPRRFVHEGKSMNRRAPDWLCLCRVLSQSPWAVQLLKISQGMVAAKGGCLSREPKCSSYPANPAMPQMVCYRQSYEAVSQSLSHGGPALSKYLYHVFQWLKSVALPGSKKRNTVSKCQRRKKNIVIIPPLLVSQRWGAIKQFQRFGKMWAVSNPALQ